MTYRKAVQHARREAKHQDMGMLIYWRPCGGCFVIRARDWDDLQNRDQNVASIKVVMPPPKERSLW